MSAIAQTNPECLEDVIKRIGDVSTLPQVALKVMEIANNPDSEVADLTRAVEGDAPLASKVLRIVNSAAYALRGKMTSLEQAVSYLGFNQIRNVALTLSVSRIFKSTKAIGPYERSMLWRHLVSVGLCARLIASRCGLSDFEDAFLVGLLHDLGIVIEDQYVHKPFCRVMESLDASGSLVDAEQAILGFDHTKIGHRMAKRWKFAEVVQAGIRYHHNSDEYNGDGALIVRCVDVANFLCTVKGVTSIGMKLVAPPREAVKALNLSKDDLKVLMLDLEEECRQNQPLFEISS